MIDSPSVVDPDAWLACTDLERPLDGHTMWHCVPICSDCVARARREMAADHDPDMRVWLADIAYPSVPADRGVPTYRPRFR